MQTQAKLQHFFKNKNWQADPKIHMKIQST